jgi:hypothetical protein
MDVAGGAVAIRVGAPSAVREGIPAETACERPHKAFRGNAGKSRGRGRSRLAPCRRQKSTADPTIGRIGTHPLRTLDISARIGLREVGLELTDNAPRFYARYMMLIGQCRAEAADLGNRWSARDVDLALWVVGGK